MNKIIFVGFDTEQKAYEGDRALSDMHRDGTLTLYNDAVVVKDPAGKVAVRRAPDAGPVGAFGGMLTGGLIGLLGGPVGAAVGLGAGTLIGAAFDLTKEGVDQDFVEDAGASLEPGKAAVIAEIDEQWQVPLDTRMETLGGTVFRRGLAQVRQDIQNREIAAMKADHAQLKAEVKTANADRKAKLQNKIADLEARIDAKQAKADERRDSFEARQKSKKEVLKKNAGAASRALKKLANTPV